MSAPEGTLLTITVGEDDAGERLDKVIAEAAGTRAHAQRLIDGGHVTVDGRQHGKSRPVQAGQVIVLTLPPERAPIAIDRSTTIPIVYEDDAVLVVDKPAGVVVHPAPGVRGITLVEQLAGKTAGGPSERPGVVHRLDRDTSGLLVMARGDHALRTLQKALRDRDVHREYLALVAGIPPSRTGTIDAPIGRDPRDRTRMAIDGEARARPLPASRSSSTCPRRRCSRWCSTPVAPTRSACTCRRSATRCSATRPTVTGRSTASSASGCTPRACTSRIRRPARSSRSTPHRRRSWTPR